MPHRADGATHRQRRMRTTHVFSKHRHGVQARACSSSTAVAGKHAPLDAVLGALEHHVAGVVAPHEVVEGRASCAVRGRVRCGRRRRGRLGGEEPRDVVSRARLFERGPNKRRKFNQFHGPEHVLCSKHRRYARRRRDSTRLNLASMPATFAKTQCFGVVRAP